MKKTIVKLIIPFTFSTGSDYQIKLQENDDLIKISIKYIQYKGAFIQEMGINVDLLQDDTERELNFSNITIEFPYRYNINYPICNPKYGIQSRKDAAQEIDRLKRDCITCLNRLIEVIRSKTYRYWLRFVSERHLNIYDIQLVDENKDTSSIFLLNYPTGYLYPISTVDEKNIQTEIDDILKNNKKIPFVDNLILDALQFFNYGRFSECVIFANICLEFGVFQKVLTDLVHQGIEINRADKLSLSFFDGFERGFKKTFLAGLNEDLLIKSKIENVRKIRRKILHTHIGKVTYLEAKSVLDDILYIFNWLSKLCYLYSEPRRNKNK